MNDIQKRIEAIEKEIRETPYHKGTEHHIGKLRAKLANLRDQLVERQVRKRGGGGGFAVKKHGDATVVLVGFPSVGKSTLVNRLTNAKSQVAPYAFTTVTVIPGMMKYKGAAIQILDVPGLIEGAAAGRGRGREVLSVIRGANLLAVVVEAGKERDFDRIKNELYANRVRINEPRPAVDIKKTIRGGLIIKSPIKQDLDKETIKSVAQEFGVSNGEIALYERITLDRLVDAFARNRVYVPAIWIVNKIDQAKSLVDSQDNLVKISAEKNIGIDMLRDVIWEKLNLARVYPRRPDGSVDYEEPIIVNNGSMLSEVAQKIGTEFASDKKEAKIWGPGARFPGQKVPLTTKVEDEMEVMFI